MCVGARLTVVSAHCNGCEPDLVHHPQDVSARVSLAHHACPVRTEFAISVDALRSARRPNVCLQRRAYASTCDKAQNHLQNEAHNGDIVTG